MGSARLLPAFPQATVILLLLKGWIRLAYRERHTAGGWWAKSATEVRPLETLLNVLSLSLSWIMHRAVLTFLSRVHLYTGLRARSVELVWSMQMEDHPRISWLCNNTLSVFLSPCVIFTLTCQILQMFVKTWQILYMLYILFELLLLQAAV